MTYPFRSAYEYDRYQQQKATDLRNAPTSAGTNVPGVNFDFQRWGFVSSFDDMRIDSEYRKAVAQRFLHPTPVKNETSTSAAAAVPTPGDPPQIVKIFNVPSWATHLTETYWK